jgi:hypothetical protein
LSSVEFHRPNSLEADLFSKFVTEEYDDKDLVFFLYLRCLLERELKIKFSKYDTIGVTKVTDIRTIRLSQKQCRKISSIFFEHDPDSLQRFMSLLESTGFTPVNKKMDASKFLILML